MPAPRGLCQWAIFRRGVIQIKARTPVCGQDVGRCGDDKGECMKQRGRMAKSLRKAAQGIELAFIGDHLARSVRGRPGAPVALPIAWNELSRLKRADSFTLRDVPARLKRRRKDPWAGIDTLQQNLSRWDHDD